MPHVQMLWLLISVRQMMVIAMDNAFKDMQVILGYQ